MPRVSGTPRSSQGFHAKAARVLALQTSRVCQTAMARTRYWPAKTAHTPPAAPPCNHWTSKINAPSRTMPSSVASQPKGPKRCNPWSKPLKIGPQTTARTASMVTRNAAGLLTARAVETGPAKIKTSAGQGQAKK